MSEVYSAYDPRLDRRIALKLLRVQPRAGINVAEGRARLLREAQAIARLSHPNVIVVFDVGTFHDRVYIAMEHIEGATLAYWLSSRPRSWPEILFMFVAAGRGLAAAHEANLVHRDFKPENVLVGRGGQIRVVDFGLVREIPGRNTGAPRVRLDDLVASDPDSVTTRVVGTPEAPLPHRRHQVSLSGTLTQAGTVMGTPAYMAPEHMLNHPADARSDQFSFCVALYEALYGERPFAGRTMGELFANIRAGHIAAPPAESRTPAWLRTVLVRGLRADREERFPTMAALLAALEKGAALDRRWMGGLRRRRRPTPVRAALVPHPETTSAVLDALARSDRAD